MKLLLWRIEIWIAIARQNQQGDKKRGRRSSSMVVKTKLPASSPAKQGSITSFFSSPAKKPVAKEETKKKEEFRSLFIFFPFHFYPLQTFLTLVIPKG